MLLAQVLLKLLAAIYDIIQYLITNGTHSIDMGDSSGNIGPDTSRSRNSI